MKKNITISIVGVMMVILLIAVALILDNQRGKEENVPILNDAIMESIIPSEKLPIDSDSFIYTILTQVPDITELADIRVTYYTMFLIMNDGSEYVVYTDIEEGKITAIYCWDPLTDTLGPEIYKLAE